MLEERIQILKQTQNIDAYRDRIKQLAGEYPYSWFVCLDFDDDPVDPELSKKMALGWVKHNARFHRAHMAPFIVVEPLYTGKRQSVHLILFSDAFISTKDLQSSWKRGFGWVRLFNASLDGERYLIDHHLEMKTHVVCHGHKPCRINKQGKVFCKKGQTSVMPF